MFTLRALDSVQYSILYSILYTALEVLSNSHITLVCGVILTLALLVSDFNHVRTENYGHNDLLLFCELAGTPVI